MRRWKSLLVLAALAAALLSMGAANAPTFQEQTVYVGPPAFNLGTAAQLERWGATSAAPGSVPAELGSSTVLVFGQCPNSLGIGSQSLLTWMHQGVALVAMGCSEAQLFAAAGGVGSIVGGWESQSHQSGSMALGSARAWWSSALQRNAHAPFQWAYLSLRGVTLRAGGGETLPQLLTWEQELPAA